MTIFARARVVFLLTFFLHGCLIYIENMKTLFPKQNRFGEWESSIVIATYRELAIGRISEWDILRENKGADEEFVCFYHRLREFAVILFVKRPKGLDHQGILRGSFPSLRECMKQHDRSLIRGFLRSFRRKIRMERLKEAYLVGLEESTLDAIEVSIDPEQSRFYACRLHAVQRMQRWLERTRRTA